MELCKGSGTIVNNGDKCRECGNRVTTINLGRRMGGESVFADHTTVGDLAGRDAPEACGVCSGAMTIADIALGLSDGHMICTGCVRARAKAAVSHKCSCGKQRQERECSTGGRYGRRWVTCDHCLGTVRQLS